MRSSVCNKQAGWKRLYSTNLSCDEQIRRGKQVLELELRVGEQRETAYATHFTARVRWHRIAV